MFECFPSGSIWNVKNAIAHPFFICIFFVLNTSWNTKLIRVFYFLDISVRWIHNSIFSNTYTYAYTRDRSVVNQILYFSNQITNNYYVDQIHGWFLRKWNILLSFMFQNAYECDRAGKCECIITFVTLISCPHD